MIFGRWWCTWVCWQLCCALPTFCPPSSPIPPLWPCTAPSSSPYTYSQPLAQPCWPPTSTPASASPTSPPLAPSPSSPPLSMVLSYTTGSLQTSRVYFLLTRRNLMMVRRSRPASSTWAGTRMTWKGPMGRVWLSDQTKTCIKKILSPMPKSVVIVLCFL